MISPLDFRQALRRDLRHARRNLSTNEQYGAALGLLSCFVGQLATLNHAQRIAFYLSNDGEISPHLLCYYCWKHNIQTYLPVLNGKQLVFASYTKETTWQENQFGIKEPINTQRLSGDELDMVFLPLVGFDAKGGRLGMGGGFYDRTFENKKADTSPMLIGLAHDIQEVSRLTVESWDVPLQAIMTPSQYIVIK
ncbi:5-formyltetrahydrofolate cyclo-ligase [Marinomonas sp. IMCC 4694]|uniref:5-formyltetrahydrofolate cyclo-ligase n=1 Tax=Marinomonas sp. IMCC 4694 TaxID=2605432 RepID=UPI0011E7E7F5|nr:5-formyltetrahydrofolate cyclo-ligase [Marinomonas sp. IMCC 4694]TYL48568.1 5-formyltetrahydrofolate cyclo-ligase [Marinomonas sp. IMCC 4694]